MIKRLFSISLLLLVGLAFFPIVQALGELQSLPPLATRYLEGGVEDYGGANIVTSVIVSYRGLDTLGEVTVLFAASAGIALVFRRRKKHSTPDEAAGCTYCAPSEILGTGAALLFPLILVFGVFVFAHGHLTPGGGFQGGVIIASGVLLLILGGTVDHLSHGTLEVLEILAGSAYVAVGFLGLWLGVGFLDPRFLPAGEFGQLFSAGAIPVIYSLIGIKVGAELSGVIETLVEMQGGQE